MLVVEDVSASETRLTASESSCIAAKRSFGLDPCGAAPLALTSRSSNTSNSVRLLVQFAKACATTARSD